MCQNASDKVQGAKYDITLNHGKARHDTVESKREGRGDEQDVRCHIDELQQHLNVILKNYKSNDVELQLFCETNYAPTIRYFARRFHSHQCNHFSRSSLKEFLKGAPEIRVVLVTEPANDFARNP